MKKHGRNLNAYHSVKEAKLESYIQYDCCRMTSWERQTWRQ